MKASTPTIIAFAVSTVAGLAFTALTYGNGKGGSTRSKGSPGPSPGPSGYEPSPSAFFASPGPQWRRARAGEVSRDMSADALATLSLPIRSFINRGPYGLAVETHYNPTKGEHKGVSVFVPV